MSDLVKWNVNNLDEEPVQELDSSMIPADPVGYIPVAEEEVSAEDAFIESMEEDEEQEEQNDTEILANARLRLEQGRLYEMLMTSNIFDNLDADQQAIKNVQREMKRFAKERMEVMLGMKEPVRESQVNHAQFNSLEVDILKSLANKLSGGKSEKSEPAKAPSAPVKSNTLTPISSGSKSKLAVKQAVKKQVQQKPEAPEKPVDEMTYDEKLEHARKREAMYNSRKAPAPQAIPMPSYDALNAANMTKASKFNTGHAALNQIAANLLKG